VEKQREAMEEARGLCTGGVAVNDLIKGLYESMNISTDHKSNKIIFL
jgi:hypothetical protein